MTEFKIPELGENVTSGDVVRVLVKPGDALKKDQPVLELGKRGDVGQLGHTGMLAETSRVLRALGGSRSPQHVSTPSTPRNRQLWLLASSAILANASASCTARSASIFRSISTPALLSPAMSRL